MPGARARLLSLITLAWTRRWRSCFPGLLRPVIFAGLLAGIVPLGLIRLPAGTSAVTTSTAAFTAAEDAFVTSTSPGSNYGQDSRLYVDNNPTAQWALVKFQVTGIPSGAHITSATLRLYAVNDAEKAGAVYAVEDDWSETAVTWANAPAVGRKLADLSGPARAESWIESDVTPAVTGEGDLDFYILTLEPNSVRYNSREAESNPPTLVVRWRDDRPSTSAAGRPPTPPPDDSPTSTPRVTPTPRIPRSSRTPMPTPEVTPTPAPSLTPTPAPSGGTPTATPSPSFQPAPPIQAAFFYPWFPKAWSQQGTYPYTNYTPSFGLYDSRDDAVIDEQLRLAARAHIEAFIASWWGQGHHTDAAFQYILGRSERSGSPYPNLRWAVYYEPEGYGDPSVSDIVSDLKYLGDKAFSHPGYLRVNGRPVVFVFGDAADRCGMADRWAQAKAQAGGNVYIVLKVFSGYRNCGSQPDSWHQYGPAKDYDSQLPYSVSVSPGFWKVGEEPRLSREPVRFESDVQQMVSSGAFWQLVTTWNEWGEGTTVETAAEFQNAYIDILCRNLPGTTPCSGGDVAPTTPAPSPTPAPTPSPSPVPSGGALTFTASEDTFVKNTSPSSNYGGRPTLEADNSPSVKRILLRFPVTGLPVGVPVTSAVLRLFVVDPSSQAGSVHLVGGSWSGATTNWSNAPAVGSKVADLSSPAVDGSWVQADVTSAVVGNGAIDFYVVTSSDNGVDYSSTERGDGNPPVLIINGSGPAPVPTPTPAPTSAPTPAPTPAPPPSGVDPILVGAGDIADCGSSGDEATAKLLDQVFASGVSGLVFTAGDNVYNAGTPSEFADCYDPSWGRHKARTRPSVGNHEYGNKDAAGYFNYFGTAAGEPGKGYYSYDLGAWHIVVLNSNCDKVGGCDAGSAQEQWLRADLAAHPSACTLAYWHHPRFSSGSHGNDISVQALWQALYDYGADVVLNGHEHDYERFAPQDPSGQADPLRGIRQFVVGMGGRNLYGFKSIQPNSEVRNSNIFGVLKLTLHPTSYDWEFIPVEGKTFTDSGSQSCN